MLHTLPYRALAPWLLVSLAGALPLQAQALRSAPMAPAAPAAALWPTPAGVRPARMPSAAAPASEPRPASAAARPAADSLAPRRRAFHWGALTGAILTGTVAGVTVSRAGDAETADPGAGAVAAATATGALIGALLGGVAGIIVYDVGKALRPR